MEPIVRPNSARYGRDFPFICFSMHPSMTQWIQRHFRLIVLVCACGVFVSTVALHRTMPAAPATTTTQKVATSTAVSASVPASLVRANHSPAPDTATKGTTAATNATLSIHGTTYPLTITRGETVETAMHALASTTATTTTPFSFTEKNYPGLGEFIESIDGVPSQDGSYWILYINGKSSSLGVSSATLSPGDAIEWKLGSSY
jgi:hypothetical protein